MRRKHGNSIKASSGRKSPLGGKRHNEKKNSPLRGKRHNEKKNSPLRGKKHNEESGGGIQIKSLLNLKMVPYMSTFEYYVSLLLRHHYYY